MIAGIVDEFGRALVPLLFQTQPQGQSVEITVWIDTAFTGDLVLPRSMISQLALKKVSNVEARLADGSISSYDVFKGWSMWFGASRKMEVIEGDSSLPLLGTRMQTGLRLMVDYASHEVRIERPA